MHHSPASGMRPCGRNKKFKKPWNRPGGAALVWQMGVATPFSPQTSICFSPPAAPPPRPGVIYWTRSLPTKHLLGRRLVARCTRQCGDLGTVEADPRRVRRGCARIVAAAARRVRARALRDRGGLRLQELLVGKARRYGEALDVLGHELLGL